MYRQSRRLELSDGFVPLALGVPAYLFGAAVWQISLSHVFERLPADRAQCRIAELSRCLDGGEFAMSAQVTTGVLKAASVAYWPASP